MSVLCSFFSNVAADSVLLPQFIFCCIHSLPLFFHIPVLQLMLLLPLFASAGTCFSFFCAADSGFAATLCLLIMLPFMLCMLFAAIVSPLPLFAFCFPFTLYLLWLQIVVLLPLFTFCWFMYKWERQELVPIRPMEGEELPCNLSGPRMLREADFVTTLKQQIPLEAPDGNN